MSTVTSTVDELAPPFSEDSVTHGHVEIDGVRLHYVEAGPPDGPLVVLLHGFPEFWYSWRYQLAVLPGRGFRVVAPDLRGFNGSDKPKRVADYRVETLAADVVGLVRSLGAERATIVGHDWGGLVAWWVAMLHPEVVERVVVMNCPHPGHQFTMMTDPRQVRRSWYMLAFQIPFVPELRARQTDYAPVRKVLRRDPEREGTFTEQDIERYVDAVRSDHGRGPFNYYRALLRRSPFELRRMLRPIDVPTQVIWGARDRHLGLEYAEPPAKWVWDLRLDLVEDASHWVQVDRPARVNALLLDFLPAPTPAK